MNAAVIGTGRMGRHVISHLQTSEYIEKLYVSDISDQALTTCLELFPWALRSTTEEILHDPEVSLVYITSSNDSHLDIATRAAYAGKSIMCEKPMSTTLAGSQQMLDRALKADIFLQIGFELRYSHLYTTVKKWIDEGLLGKIVSIQCTYICSEFHHKNSWRNQTATGGSMFGEKLSHYADLCRWFMGDSVHEVYSACAPNVVKYFEVHDNYQTTLRFTNGGVAHITFMMNLAAAFEGDPLENTVDQQQGDGHELRFLIVGEDGAAETDVFQRQIKRWKFTDTPEKLHSQWVETVKWPSDKDHSYFHNTTDQALDIAKRVAEELPPMTSPADSFETMLVCEAAERSALWRKSVSISSVRSELPTSVLPIPNYA